MLCLNEKQILSGHKLSRRHFLRLGLVAGLMSCIPSLSFAVPGDYQPAEKSLSFYNIHTGESLKTVYWARGNYVSESLHDINCLMRDHRTNDIKLIDTRLLDLFYAISAKLKTRKYFHVISGYRSPSTNAFLFRYYKDVAKNSLHMYGKAVDIRLPGCDLSVLRQLAMSLRGGGVGYYPKSNFVHIDVGEVHYW